MMDSRPAPDPPSADPARHRLPSLDGLRAVAIGLVVYSHATGTEGFPARLRWPLPDGGVGVRIFFVLSGFLITSLLVGERARTGGVSLAGFYRRRAVRILPPYWAYLLFAAVLWASGTVALRPANLLAPLTFTNGFRFWPKHATAWVTAHTWSLAVEEQFYLVWPVAFAAVTRVLPRRAGPRVLLAGLSVVLVYGPVARADMYLRPWQAEQIYSARGNVDVLAWGCALALAWQAWPAAVDRCLLWRPALGRAAAVVVILYAQTYCGRAFGFRYGWSAWGGQAAAVTYLIGSLVHVRRGVTYRLLNARPVVWAGLLSYSLYLWQEPFFDPNGGQAPHVWQRWPLNLMLAAGAACGSYGLIEVPARRWRGRLANPLDPPATRGDGSADVKRLGAG